MIRLVLNQCDRFSGSLLGGYLLVDILNKLLVDVGVVCELFTNTLLKLHQLPSHYYPFPLTIVLMHYLKVLD